MAPSQLKSLKASLRQKGLLGPQQSKKERQRGGKGTSQQREKRNAALAEVREQFRPFEVKQLARGSKYETANDQSRNAILGRPGVTKGRGEEVRRSTLLKEMQKRKKVGGVVDRRFGEDNPSMTPEDRALQRFVREKQSQGRKSTLFDLEDDEDTNELTHRGRALFSLNETPQDDFDGADLNGSNSDTDREGDLRAMKRLRSEDYTGELSRYPMDRDERDDRPKSKKEVMQEVIAKSKLHRYERQKAKEDDEDLRDALDADTSDMLRVLRTSRTSAVDSPDAAQLDPTVNPDRAALLAGKDRDEADREYDLRLRQMAQEKRAQPTVRTKTDDERAQEEAERLKELEEKRLRRMRGESVSEDQQDDGAEDNGLRDDFEEDNILGDGLKVLPKKELDVEDEDEFELDHELVADGSDLELESPSHSGDSAADADNSDDDEFVAGLLSEEDAGRIRDQPNNTQQHPAKAAKDATTLAFTYPCPQTHSELIEVTKGTDYKDLHTVIQRIRALHHPRLAEENKRKLGHFASVLVEHIAYLARADPAPPLKTLEAVMRHVHSLAKSYPINVANSYREHLKQIHLERPLDLHRADLILVTAIATTFPTSDLFHPVSTPAMMTLARFLGQKIPKTFGELVASTYTCTLCVQFQALSRRYVPEVANFLLLAISLLAPVEPQSPFGALPIHEAHANLRIHTAGKPLSRAAKLQLDDINNDAHTGTPESKQALMATLLHLVEAVSELWASKDSFLEIFSPFSRALAHLQRPAVAQHLATATNAHIVALEKTLSRAIREHQDSRLPLTLHHHRPRPIRTLIPKFEADFHPDKHYDVDAARAEGARLRAAHRRERKGAVRELRKDASFVARESLREQKEREAAYQAKYNRLIARIQGEEGAEGNRYEREKRLRRSQR